MVKSIQQLYDVQGDLCSKGWNVKTTSDEAHDLYLIWATATDNEGREITMSYIGDCYCVHTTKGMVMVFGGKAMTVEEVSAILDSAYGW